MAAEAEAKGLIPALNPIRSFVNVFLVNLCVYVSRCSPLRKDNCVITRGERNQDELEGVEMTSSRVMLMKSSAKKFALRVKLPLIAMCFKSLACIYMLINSHVHLLHPPRIDEDGNLVLNARARGPKIYETKKVFFFSFSSGMVWMLRG
jgi:hypothetical protein